jgi:hypothetical protein
VDEAAIEREDVLVIMGALATSSSMSETSGSCSERMAMKRETKKEKVDRIHRESENLPSVRRLRERVERGYAELERRKAQSSER